MEFYLRHTVYTKVERWDALEATYASVEIAERIRKYLEEQGLEIMDLDSQKSWEIVAQDKYQKMSR